MLWWWKNGREHKKENFGVKYEKSGEKVSTFQPDFIVQFEDGRIGIFDTKDQDDRQEDTKEKAEALQKYVKSTKRKDLFGGIIVKDGDTFYINSKSTYKTFKEKKDDWKPFTF